MFEKKEGDVGEFWGNSRTMHLICNVNEEVIEGRSKSWKEFFSAPITNYEINKYKIKSSAYVCIVSF